MTKILIFIENDYCASHNNVVILHTNIQEDKLSSIKVHLPHQGKCIEETVVSRKRNSDKQVVGNEHKFAALDHREYIVDLGDGNYAKYTANILMENIYDYIDDDGRISTILKGFINYRRNDDTILKQRRWTTLPSGIKKRFTTIKGWNILVE